MSDITKDDYKLPAASKDYFSKLHTMVLTIGFPRSGSSLVGYLLTAHPNMIMGHEPDVKTLYRATDIMIILSYILYTDQTAFTKAKKIQKVKADKIMQTSNKLKPRTFYSSNRYVFVPNQWQNRCKSLEVIGIKRSLSTTRRLLEKNILRQFTRRLKKKKISLKFIFTVRNPYDMIVTSIMNKDHKKGLDKEQKQNRLSQTILIWENQCALNSELLNRIKPQDIFVNKHEDMLATPTDQLTTLCRYLKVETDQNYLNDCASVVCQTPRKSRYELDWSEEQKKKVAKLIEQYDFLSGYSWSS